MDVTYVCLEARGHMLLRMFACVHVCMYVCVCMQASRLYDAGLEGWRLRAGKAGCGVGFLVCVLGCDSTRH